MSPGSQTIKTTVRLLETVSEKLTNDPIAQVNVSAFIRAALDNLIAYEMPIESTKALGIRLNCKTVERPTQFSLPQNLHEHYSAYAKAANGQSFSSLVVSALYTHYFGAIPVSTPTIRAVVHPVRAGWRKALLSLVVGETREYAREDLPTPPRKAGALVHFTATAVRMSIPSFRVSTRVTPSCLFVSRVA